MQLIPLVRILFSLYTTVLVVRVFLSWLPVKRDNPLVEFVINSTDPLLRPISKLIPPLGGMVDLSPIIALILLQVLEALIVGLLAAS
ncbi:MAG: hypothetical protein A2284_17680 [Deltaproteobacteria bacterium RIFOXYA12_FULL_61_11]|nr:MAG: hypothetical protein A2284_17680 [Deltaproteobacteria bacterium RIFOXYA12_FULL_61_11]